MTLAWGSLFLKDFLSLRNFPIDILFLSGLDKNIKPNYNLFQLIYGIEFENSCICL